MADVTDLFKALPYGLFDKRTWSPTARDDFAKKLADEEAMRQYDKASKLQSEQAAQNREVQNAYLQKAYDLAASKEREKREQYRQGMYNLKAADTLRTVPDINPEELDAIARHFAEQAVAGMDAGSGVEAAKKGIGAVQTLGTEPDIAANRAAGELAAAKLLNQRNNYNLSDLENEIASEKKARGAKDSVNEILGKAGVLGVPGLLNYGASVNALKLRAPLIQSNTELNKAKAGVAEEERIKKETENKITQQFAPGAKQPPVLKRGPDGKLVPAEGSAPVRVNDVPGAPVELVPDVLTELINRSLLNLKK